MKFFNKIFRSKYFAALLAVITVLLATRESSIDCNFVAGALAGAAIVCALTVLILDSEDDNDDDDSTGYQR